VSMKQSRIFVRLDAEQRIAELEVRVPHLSPRTEGLEAALRQLRMRSLTIVEISTPQFRILRTRLVECDGSEFDANRVMQILQAARDPQSAFRTHRGEHAA
jgi:uncharacterized coiled-coil protein SlyX